jgi:uncharacterized RDD family membrane protein YckC
MEKYETFWRRVGAAFLDSVVLIPVNWGVSFAVVLLNTPSLMLSWAVPSFIASLYYILMHYYGGQTLGKMAAKVKVLDDSENRLSLGQAILRSLPQLLIPMFAVSFSTADPSAAEPIALWAGVIYGFTVVFWIADAMVCLASEKRRALHDFIAGTIVVRTDV